MLTGLPPWVRSAKISRVSFAPRVLSDRGSATDWSSRRLRAGTTAASAKIGFPVNNRKNTGEFSTERRVGGWSREGEWTGFVRAAASGFVLPNLPFPPNLTWGGLSGSFGHNTAGLRGGFSCLIRAIGFVTSSWVRLAHIVPMCLPRFTWTNRRRLSRGLAIGARSGCRVRSANQRLSCRLRSAGWVRLAKPANEAVRWARPPKRATAIGRLAKYPLCAQGGKLCKGVRALGLSGRSRPI